MKIEILEQAFASYLRNCEGCLISQTNWKVTPKMMSGLAPATLKEVELMIQDIKSQTNIDVFKKNKARQFISQCEIDIVGLKSDKNNAEIFLFDTAFHEKGLNYNDTAASVCKKLIRAFIIGKLFFDGYKIHVGFVSPKCNPKTLNKINNSLNVIIPALQKYSSSISVETYLNDKCGELINDLASLVDDINDDGDLFIRAVKLWNLTNKSNPPQNNANLPQSQPANQTNQDHRTLIYDVVDTLVQNNKMTPGLIANLCDVTYSKNAFKLSGYPFMIEVNQIPAKDHRRYYAKYFTINGKSYRICSQWYDDRIIALQNWMKTI